MFQFRTSPLILVVTTLLAIPFSRYLAWIMEGRYRARGFCAGSSARGHRAAELETVRRCHDAVQHADVRLRLRRAGDPTEGRSAVEPGRQGDAGARPRSSTPSFRFSRTPTCSITRASSTSPISARYSSFAGTCFCRRAWAFAGWWRSSARLRSDPHVGNYYLDMWRVAAYTFVPASLIMGVLLMADGVPMTLAAPRR